MQEQVVQDDFDQEDIEQDVIVQDEIEQRFGDGLVLPPGNHTLVIEKVQPPTPVNEKADKAFDAFLQPTVLVAIITVIVAPVLVPYLKRKLLGEKVPVDSDDTNKAPVKDDPNSPSFWKNVKGMFK